MNKSGKVVITLGIVSSALFAVWLLSDNWKVKAREFVSRKAITFKDVMKLQKAARFEEHEHYYI